MKAAPLAYARATSLDDVFALWRSGGEDARLLAGGQSLVAGLNLRLADVPALIDINHVETLSGIEDVGGSIRIGALTRHRELAQSPLLARHVPLLPQAAHQIAHPAIRTRGTVGGSLAYADPAAELPACMVALDATFILFSEGGAERRIPADDFFLGLFETALNPFEMIGAIEIPKIAPGGRHRLLELARRSGDYAVVGLAATAAFEGDRLSKLSPVFFGIGDRPVLADLAAQMVLDGRGMDAALEALRSEIAPSSDMNGSAEYKRHLAGVLFRRVLADLSRENVR